MCLCYVSELYDPILTRQNHPLEPSVKECPGKGSVVAIFIFSRCLAEELSCGSYVNAVKHEWLTLIPPVEKIQVLSTSSVTTSSMNLSKCSLMVRSITYITTSLSTSPLMARSIAHHLLLWNFKYIISNWLHNLCPSISAHWAANCEREINSKRGSFVEHQVLLRRWDLQFV